MNRLTSIIVKIKKRAILWLTVHIHGKHGNCTDKNVIKLSIKVGLQCLCCKAEPWCMYTQSWTWVHFCWPNPIQSNPK